MDEELEFSLSYEQLLQETEEQIKKCYLRREGPYYSLELSKAADSLHFWHRLVNRGYPGVGDYNRIKADWQRLNALIDKKCLMPVREASLKMSCPPALMR